jgi:hypothetical protein
VVAGAPAPAAPTDDLFVEDFERDSPGAGSGPASPLGAEGWSLLAARGASAALAVEEGALRLDFDFRAGGGWASARKEVSLALPANYVFSFRVRGTGSVRNELQLKLVDPSGANVWWWRQRGFEPPDAWQRIVVRRPRIAFAWGPAGGGAPRRVGSLELAIAVEEGGQGTLWIDDLHLEEREPPSRQPVRPEVSASSQRPGHEPALAVDRDPATGWRNDPADLRPWLGLDFGRPREFGGLVIDWEPGAHASAYRVELSEDGAEWVEAYRAEAAHGGRDYLYLPDSEARAIRLVLERGAGVGDGDGADGDGEGGAGGVEGRAAGGAAYGIRWIGIAPLEFSASPNRFMERLARESPRGTYPRYLLGEQTHWAVVGADGDDAEGLLSDDGMLEVGREAFSIEPFLWVDGRAYAWSDVFASASLADGELPIPRVTWQVDGLALRITAFADGPPGASTLVARYRVENAGRARRRGRLLLAIRPFQVSPPWQSLNLEGGVARIHRIEREGAAVRVDGSRTVVPLAPASDFGAARSEEGPLSRFVAAGEVPPSPRVDDPLGFASAVLAFDLDLAPGRHEEVSIAVPLHEATPPPAPAASRRDAAARVADRLDAARAAWRARLGGFALELPPAGRPLAESVRASLGWILVNRDGPRLQPGSRCYERSWIRDGSITSSALLEYGFAEEARAFVRWYAPFQLEDGRVPCCVDRRGADLVPEHDSHGQLVWAVMEIFRHTQDRAFLAELWPRVVRAVEAIERLRAERLGPAFDAPAQRAFRGLLPESISHEGYAARPVHSYWDDFFALRGVRDAAAAAVVLGDGERALRFAAQRDALRADLAASIRATIAAHGLDTVPASVELADFDPNSTTIALAPAGEREILPADALARTYERYWEEFERRRAGESEAEAYTPYEVRNAEAFLLLGAPERAHAILDFLVDDQRPRAWRQWPEIAWRERNAPRFVGDLPHGWVASSFLRAVRRLFADERERDAALVLAAGVPEAWVDTAPGVRVAGLSTHYGTLAYAMRADGPDRVRVELARGLAVPPGGIEIRSPRARRLRAAHLNGRRVVHEPTYVVVRELPASVVLEYGAVDEFR